MDNVAHAVELSLTKGRSKEIYFVSDDTPNTFREFMEPVLATQGIDAGNRSLPNGLAKFLATLLEGIWRLLRIKSAPPLNRFEWSFAGQARRYCIDKIKMDLGYKPIITTEEGLAQMKS